MTFWLTLFAVPLDMSSEMSSGHVGASCRRAMGEQPSAGTFPSVFSLPHPSASFLAPSLQVKLLRGAPSMVPLPSALGFMSEYRSTLGMEGYKCKVCGKYFSDATDCQAHARVPCHKREMLACDYCDMAFARRFNLKVHLRCRHGIGEQLTCADCGITFRSKVRLQTHKCVARKRTDRAGSGSW